MMRRALLIGFGARARVWAKLLADGADTDLAAVVEPLAEQRSSFAALYPDVPTFPTLAEALGARKYDMAVLVTPPWGRLPDIRALLAARLPILAEKPLALDLTEARDIVVAAENAGTPLTVGLNFRFLPVSQALREIVTSEKFGAAGFGQMIYARNRDGYRPGLNRYPLTMQDPMMLEQSIHHLDLIRFCYAREIETVSCRSYNPSWSQYRHDANVHCLLGLEGGLEVAYVGTWTGGWNALQFQWRTDFSGGVAIQRQLFEDLATARTDDSALTEVVLERCEAFRDDTARLLAAFLAALDGHGEIPCTGRDHLVSLAVCFAAIESARTGREISVPAFLAANGITS